MKRYFTFFMILTIAILLIFSLSSCNEKKTSDKDISATIASTIAITTTEPTEENTISNSATETYDFDENTHYSTPEGIFNKPIDSTNEQGDMIISTQDIGIAVD